MLTQTVSALAVHRTASLTRLQQVEKQIEQASVAEDLRQLRTSLAECLVSVRECSLQQRQSGETMQLFERHLQTVKSHLKEASAAESEPPVPKPTEPLEYYAVFVVDRESGIAARFGEEVRAGVSEYISRQLKEALAPGDRLVRWKGPAFLALLKRTATLQEMCGELANVTSIPSPPLIEAGRRSIRLPISLSWAVFPQSRYPTLEVRMLT